MMKTFLDKSNCHLMDTKRPNYETVVVRMAPKFTKSWSKRENKIMYIEQFKSFDTCDLKSYLFIHPEKQEE